MEQNPLSIDIHLIRIYERLWMQSGMIHDKWTRYYKEYLFEPLVILNIYQHNALYQILFLAFLFLPALNENQ